MSPAERQRFAKMANKQARERWGYAWQMLSDDMRQAFVCREIVGIIAGWAEGERIPVAEAQAIISEALGWGKEASGEEPK